MYLNTLSCLLNKHARLFFSREKSTLLALIGGHFIDHSTIFCSSFIKFEDKFQPTRLLES